MKKSLATTQEEKPSEKASETSGNVPLASTQEEAAIGGAEKEPQPGTSQSARQQTNVKSASPIKKIWGNIKNIWKRKKTDLPGIQPPGQQAVSEAQPGTSQHSLPQASLLPQETPKVKSRITAIFMDILQHPQQLGSVAEMTAILSPSKSVIATTSVNPRVAQLQQWHINHIFKGIILPLLTEERIARMVNQVNVEATFDEPTIRSQAANLIRESIPELLKVPVIPLQVEIDPQTQKISINRAVIREDVGSMIAIPMPSGGKAFARVAVNDTFAHFGTEDFCFKISGIDLGREGFPRRRGEPSFRILPKHRPASSFSIYDSYDIEVRDSGIGTAPARWEAGQQLTLTGLVVGTTYPATIVSIGTEENPLVRLAMPALDGEQKAALERNIPILRENGEVTYGRAIYQFPDKSELNWWGSVKATKVKTGEFLQKIEFNDWLQVDNILKEIKEVNTRITNTFNDILRHPTQLGATAEMIALLLPCSDSQATAIAAMMQELTRATTGNEEKVKQLNNIISTAILPRVNKARLAEKVNNYDYAQGVDELSIRNQAAAIIRGSLRELLREPVIPVRVVQTEQGWRVTRDFIRADIDSMVAIPMLDGTTAFARVAFEDNDFCLKMTGADRNVVRQAEAIAIARTSSIIPYDIFLREATLVARATSAGTEVGNVAQNGRTYPVTIASMGTGETPFVRLKMPVNLDAEEKAGLQRNIPIMREEGKITYGRAIYQFPDETELSWWDPVQQLDLLLSEVYAENIKRAVHHKIYQSGIDADSAAIMLKGLLPDQLKALSVATLMEAGRVPPELTADLPVKINAVIREIIWQRLSENEVEEGLSRHHFDYAKFATTGADVATFVNQQADDIVQALLTKSLNEPVIPIHIERTDRTSRSKANRNFTPSDIGRMVAIPLPQGKTVMASVVFEDNDFCLKVAGVSFDSETITSLNAFEVARPSSDIPYRVIYEEKRDQIVNEPERWQAGQQLTLTFEGEDAPVSVKIASIGTGENPIVQLDMSELGDALKRNLRKKAETQQLLLLSYNVPVIRNGEIIWARISCQFRDGSELVWQDPRPVEISDEPDEPLATKIAKKIANQLGLQQLVDELLPKPMLNVPDDAGLSGAGFSEHNLRLVNEWAIPEVKPLSDTLTRFDGQLILQLENDPVVRESVAKLAGKHSNSSVVLQLDNLGNYQVVYGDPTIVQGKKNLRLQVVGHGRGGIGDSNHQTHGGYSPTALAENIQQLSAAYGINHALKHVSLVGCGLAGSTQTELDYARQFALSLSVGEWGIQADISARRVRVNVDDQGRKTTQASDGSWGHKISDDKLVLHWDQQGRLLPATTLTARLERVLALADAIHTGKTLITALDTTERSLLADFFPRGGGGLDVRQLTLTTVDGIKYQTWRDDAYQLLQSRDTHPQLAGLSGQAALQQSQTLLDDFHRLQTGGVDPVQTATAVHPQARTNTPANTNNAQVPPGSTSTPASSRLASLNRWSGRASYGMQGYGYTRGLYDLIKYHRMLNSPSLSEEEKNNLTFERNLAIASFTSNAGIDITQYGLGKLGEHLARRATSGFIPGSRLGSIGFTAGTKLTRFGGPALGGLSAGFDIYSAYRAFSALATETDPKKRQDLMVSGSFSVVGAAVAMGTAAAFALGGTAAMVAGPAGLVIGVGLILGGEIYSAVRQIEDIKKYVDLSLWEELENGWRIFTGQDTTPDVFNRTAYNRTLEEARKEYDRRLADAASALLLADSKIDRFYYSQGQVVLQEYHYQEIVVKDIAGGEHIIQERILATENVQQLIPAALAAFRERSRLTPINRRVSLNGQPSVRNSKFKYFIPKALASTDDSLDVSHGAGDAVQAPFTGQHQRVGKLVDQNDQSLSVALNLINPDYHAVMGDFNADGRLDIGYFSQQGFYLLLADKNGGYDQARLVSDIESIYYGIAGSAANPRRLVADINADGWDDIIIDVPGTDTVEILLAKEDGQFTRQTPQALLPPGRSARPVNHHAPVSGDTDGDGCADLVWFSQDEIRVYYGTRQGVFSTEDTLFVPQATDRRILEVESYGGLYAYQGAADVNGDGFDDVVSLTREGAIHTLLGGGDRQKKLTALATQSYTLVSEMYGDQGFKPSQIQLKDMNADGRADLVAIRNNGRYSISYGQADGTFGPVTYDSQREEKGKTVSYRPNILAVRGQQHILGITQSGDGNQVLLSLNKAGEINAHTFKPTPVKETTAYFRLGDGNDTVIGDPDRKNVFEVEGGMKQFTGGRYADSFLLQGKPAAETESLFDGAGSTSDDSDINDIVIAGKKPTEGGGYSIFLGENGFVAYTANNKQIARLRNIEHAQGHKDTDDLLVGNARGNQLNGMGGKDTLLGHAGNDMLSLQAGKAEGGTGMDSYRILQNDRDQNVTVTLKEAADTEEISNILLDHQVGQIQSLTVEGNDVVFNLRNDNGTLTTLRLADLYSSPDTEQQKKLQHSYILYTHDGLMLSGFPPTLSQDAQGNGPLTFSLTAQYKPELDRNWQARTKDMSEARIVITLNRVAGKILFEEAVEQEIPGSVTVPARRGEILLPEFIQLVLQGTRFNDHLIGDDDSNLLRSTQGKDRLAGKGRMDHYLIDNEGETGSEVVIDNEDPSLADDILWLSLAFNQIRLEQQNDDIVLSHQEAPELHPRVRIVNFMQHERYRHLSVVDKEGTLLALRLSEGGKVVLGPELVFTNNDDNVMLYHGSAVNSKILNSGAGNDRIVDTSGAGHILRGGDGDDILVVGSGNNVLYGEAGNDQLYGGIGNDVISGDKGNDTLSGGANDDILWGGVGDDVYLFANGDGLDTLFDSDGHDSLKFTDLAKEKLWLEKHDNDLRIVVDGKNFADGVLIKNYYADQRQKIEVIEATGYQLTGDNIDQLVTIMAAFPSPDGVSSLRNERVQTQINRLWVAVPEH